MSSMSEEQMRSKLSLMMLAEIREVALHYVHTEIYVNLPRLKGFSPYEKVAEAQRKADEFVETYHNDKLVAITEVVT